MKQIQASCWAFFRRENNPNICRKRFDFWSSDHDVTRVDIKQSKYGGW